MATRLRQAAAFALVAGRHRVPACRPRLRLLFAGASRRGDGTVAGFPDREAHRRSHRRADRRPHRRRPALLQLYGHQVQSRRHPVAVLGAGRLCLPPRLARRLARALASARPGDRHLALGQVFRRGTRGATRRIPRVRQRRAKDTRNARPLHCRSGRARDHGAASGLAGAERLPAFFLRRAPRAAITRADRPCLASLPVRARSGILPRAFGPHCCAAVFPEAEREEPWRRPIRPAHRQLARLRPDGDGVGNRRRSAAAEPWRCGAIRSFSF